MELLFLMMAVTFLETVIVHELKLLMNRSCYIHSLPQEVRYQFSTSLYKVVNKRLFDIVFSLMVLLILFPLIFLIVSPLIKLTSKGPVFFIQKRLGLYGKAFNCYKFRTMYVNSVFKPTQPNDDRVTKIGKFLRKTHIDEFPQFFNVLIGDMSIVGPRPFPSIAYQEFPYFDKSLLRLVVRPGITGFAQLNVQRNKDRGLVIKNDFYYIRRMSLACDLTIILRTMLLKDNSF